MKNIKIILMTFAVALSSYNVANPMINGLIEKLTSMLPAWEENSYNRGTIDQAIAEIEATQMNFADALQEATQKYQDLSTDIKTRIARNATSNAFISKRDEFIRIMNLDKKDKEQIQFIQDYKNAFEESKRLTETTNANQKGYFSTTYPDPLRNPNENNIICHAGGIDGKGDALKTELPRGYFNCANQNTIELEKAARTIDSHELIKPLVDNMAELNSFQKETLNKKTCFHVLKGATDDLNMFTIENLDTLKTIENKGISSEAEKELAEQFLELLEKPSDVFTQCMSKGATDPDQFQNLMVNTTEEVTLVQNHIDTYEDELAEDEKAAKAEDTANRLMASLKNACDNSKTNFINAHATLNIDAQNYFDKAQGSVNPEVIKTLRNQFTNLNNLTAYNSACNDIASQGQIETCQSFIDKNLQGYTDLSNKFKERLIVLDEEAASKLLEQNSSLFNQIKARIKEIEFIGIPGQAWVGAIITTVGGILLYVAAKPADNTVNQNLQNLENLRAEQTQLQNQQNHLGNILTQLQYLQNQLGQQQNAQNLQNDLPAITNAFQNLVIHQSLQAELQNIRTQLQNIQNIHNPQNQVPNIQGQLQNCQNQLLIMKSHLQNLKNQLQFELMHQPNPQGSSWKKGIFGTLSVICIAVGLYNGYCGFSSLV